ncbi:YncE family protein [bacterium]|nr:YncE family protein [bacterium]
MRKSIIKLSIVSMLLLISLRLNAIDLSVVKTFSGACAPKSVDVSPDGKYVAVMNLECLNFWLIDRSNLKIIKKIKFKATHAKGWNYQKNIATDSYAQKPVESCFSNDSRFLWVSLHNAKAVVVYDTQGKLKTAKDQLFERTTTINLLTNKNTTAKVIKIETGKTPKVIEITPDGKYALVANWHSHSISIIDAKTYKKVKDIPMKGKFDYIPRGIAISSDSKRAYIANMRGGTISIIDLDNLKVISDIWITPNPRHIVLTKDDKYLYISDNIGGKVIKYDIINKKKIAQTTVGKYTRTIVLSPDGNYVYANSYGENFIGVIDTKTMKLLKKVDFPSPMGLSISPDGEQLWVTSYRKGLVRVYKISKLLKK